MMYLRWVLIFIPALVIEFACYLLAPLVALFIYTEPRFDRVKRLGNKSVTLPRDYLIKHLSWFQTHDNAVDEWWYGDFHKDSHFKWLRDATQADYDKSWTLDIQFNFNGNIKHLVNGSYLTPSAWFLRYVCRVHWLWRNCAYGFHYNLFSAPVESLIKTHTKGTEDVGFWYQLQTYKSSFQLEAHIPFGKRYFSLNIGHKHHKGFNRKMYANRIPPFGIRQYK